MRRRTILAFALLGGLAGGCRGPVPAPVDAGVSAAAFDRRALDLMASVQVPGLQLATVQDGRVTERAFGVADAKTRAPVNAETVFEAASLSKPVFAFAVLRLAADGRFDLDRPLDAFLAEPYLKDPRSRLVTARLVLSHRSGLPNWRPRGKDLAFAFDPGTRFSYSGEGFVWLQRAVEASTREPLDAFVRRMVFEPAGMTHSSYVWRDAYEGTKAWGHDEAGTRDEKRNKPDAPNVAWSLHTTAGDLARFLAAIFERRGLSNASVREMLRPAADPPEGCAACAGVASPGLPSTVVAWGLGWGLVRGERRAFWHWGDNGRFKDYIFGDDTAHRGVVVLTNGSAGLAIAGDLAALALADDPVAAREAEAPFPWLKYDRPDAPAKVALRDVLTGKGRAAFDAFLAQPDVDQGDVNRLGYALPRSGHVSEALAAFETNAKRHADTWNAWDSLGEGLAVAGRREEAIVAYRRSLALNASNEEGAKALEKLEKGAEAAK
jgi:CubicO group peptidase (beta-lactamase class C family)